MATQQDDDMPPQPDLDFDFNLPHGIEDEDDRDQIERPRSSLDNDDSLQNHDSPEDTHQTTERNFYSDVQNKNLVHQDMNYDMLEKGFSDDDDAPEAFNRSWSAQQARKSPPKKKKSPRSEDYNDEASPRSKKQRMSLFGGPSEEIEEDQFDDLFAEQPEDRLLEQVDDLPQTKFPKQSIGNRMHSLNIEQQEREEGPREKPLNLGFGLGDSDRESISPRASPALSDEKTVIPADTQPAYELRQGIDRKTTYTYVDQDESGNFDPTNETRNSALKSRQAKAAKVAKAAQQLKKGKRRASKETVLKCIVKLRIERFGNVRNITNDKDNWPEDWSDIDSEAERELQEYRGFFRRNTPDRNLQLPIQDPRSEVDDLTGHPAARGCISCRIHGTDCSLVTGGTYPCQHCCNQDQECEPIIPPTEKGRCKQCVDAGNDYCSFEGEPGQAICDHCEENEHICEALPPVGYRAKRIIIDEVIYTEDRPHIQCTNCRQDKKRCSLKKKTDKPPCKYCRKHNIGCTFYNIPKVVKEKKVKAKGPTEGEAPEVAVPDHNYFTKEDLEDIYMEDVRVESRSPTPELEMEDNAGHKGKLTKIKTSFAHPVQFGALENVSDCDFCEQPAFAFVGLFEKEVHVIRWYSGHGYTEVGGGHAENIKGGTTMCENCTFSRAQIVFCEEHDMQHIFPNTKASSFEETFADLLESAEGSSIEIQQQLQRWCSMCFSPATFTCCTRQVSLSPSEDADQEIGGCGLRLCTTCEVKLWEDFDGDSSLMAETLDREGKAKAGDEDPERSVVRADVGFLSSEGLLMKSLACAADEADI